MVTIAVDEKACVGCSLCVDICVTKVFNYDEAKQLPVVSQPAECFGCLSCSEICPADALRHEGVPQTECFYHDPEALALAARMAGSGWTAPLTPDDPAMQDRAMRDLGVRLLSVAAVFKQTLGNSLPAVGTIAGRTLAGQLPRYRVPKDMAEALVLAREQFAPAWELTFRQAAPDQLTVEVGACFVRDLCAQEKLEIGGELCILFYNYLAGYLSKMGGARPKLVSADRGAAKCAYEVKLF
jgi:ferredoxin